jgi:hypothetical protein
MKMILLISTLILSVISSAQATQQIYTLKYAAQDFGIETNHLDGMFCSTLNLPTSQAVCAGVTWEVRQGVPYHQIRVYGGKMIKGEWNDRPIVEILDGRGYNAEPVDSPRLNSVQYSQIQTLLKLTSASHPLYIAIDSDTGTWSFGGNPAKLVKVSASCEY